MADDHQILTFTTAKLHSCRACLARLLFPFFGKSEHFLCHRIPKIFKKNGLQKGESNRSRDHTLHPSFYNLWITLKTLLWLFLAMDQMSRKNVKCFTSPYFTQSEYIYYKKIKRFFVCNVIYCFYENKKEALALKTAVYSILLGDLSPY